MYEEYMDIDRECLTMTVNDIKNEVYGNRKRVSLGNAVKGDYYLFVTADGVETALECLGSRTKHWWDEKIFYYREKRNYELPYFKATTAYGEKECFITGVGVKVTEEEYKEFLIEHFDIFL